MLNFVLYSIEECLRYSWIFVGQPVIFISSILYWNKTRSRAGLIVLAGCLLIGIGKVVFWWGEINAILVITDGFKSFEHSTSVTTGLILKYGGGILLAAGVLCCVMSHIAYRNKHNNEH
jgi:hypothetical protein